MFIPGEISVQDLKVVLNEDPTSGELHTIKLIKNQSDTFELFSGIVTKVLPIDNNKITIESHEIIMVGTGDLAFLSTMFGKPGMSLHHCIIVYIASRHVRIERIHHLIMTQSNCGLKKHWLDHVLITMKNIQR